MKAFLAITFWALATIGVSLGQANIPFTTYPALQTYDMLQWMTMQPADSNGNPLSSQFHLSGTANPLFTSMQADRFFWTKTGSGYPWDVQLYDDNYVYLWVTELSWSNPGTFKVFRSPVLGNFNMPLVPRFVTAGASPGKLASIEVSDSTYEIHTGCMTYTTKTLGHVVNEVWGPYTETWSGNLPPNLKTLVISYRYGCNGSYSNCGDKEEFHVAYPFGLVHWQHQKWNGLGYNPPDNQTTFNKVTPGTVTPSIACGANFDGN